MDPGDPVAHWNRGGAAVRRTVGGQRHPGYPRHRRGGIRRPARQAIGEKGITEKRKPGVSLVGTPGLFFIYT